LPYKQCVSTHTLHAMQSLVLTDDYIIYRTDKIMMLLIMTATLFEV